MLSSHGSTTALPGIGSGRRRPEARAAPSRIRVQRRPLTAPVSSPTTARGRLIYGGGIGVLTYVIRTFGSYPDGIAFAVLLMNLAAPLIERWTRPRVYGRPA
jgi:hypothetical protein